MRQELPTPAPGAMVRARGESWRLVDAAKFEGCSLCHLAGIGASNRGARRSLLIPFDRLLPLAPARNPSRVGRRAWVRALRSLLVESAAAGRLRAAAAGRLDLMPHQLEPALACLQGETRLLLADEVGLGKTVQAGLILAELLARNPSARCLVLVPAPLCGQWVEELRHRFDLPAGHVDASRLRAVASLSGPGVTPWEQLPLPVASLDYVKQPEVLAGMAGLRWDILVVDEAHVAAVARERAAAIGRLAESAVRVMLLTATPYAADAEGFRALCEIGRFTGEPPIVLFRRTRAALGIACTRRASALHVALSVAERRMHAALDRYASAVWQASFARSGRPEARLAMIVLRKRASSGPAALEASLSRRLRLLDPDPEDEASQLTLPLGEASIESADDEPAAVLAAPGLEDVGAERRQLEVLLQLARAARTGDSKLRVLRRLLARTREPAIVFTEYRDTLARLAAQLQDVSTIALLHGGLDQPARDEAVRSFTSGHVRTLLATDAAAHGLNLHARCRLVVNVELPWTPARLEQRIGRVDRIGQRRLVHALNFVSRGTVEELILARLVVRVGRERAVLGPGDSPLGSVREDETARAIFGSPGDRVRAAPCAHHYLTEPKTSIDPERAGCSGNGASFRRLDLEASARDEAGRLEWQRRLIAAGRSLARRRPKPAAIAGVPWTVIRPRRAGRLPPGVICVFSAALVDGRGSLVENTLLVYHVALHRTVLARRALGFLVPSIVAACRKDLQLLANRAAADRCDGVRGRVASGAAGLAARERALAGARSSVLPPLQPGLFDRRAVKRDEAERRRRDRQAGEAAKQVERGRLAARLELAGPPDLVLVLGIAQ